MKTVELFKLRSGNLDEELKPKLPVPYKRAIIDYHSNSNSVSGWSTNPETLTAKEGRKKVKKKNAYKKKTKNRELQHYHHQTIDHGA